MLKNIYTVGQISEYISNMFREDFMLRNISVKGEVSNCTYHSTGHIYFTIKDGDGVLKGVMFSGSRKNLKFQLREGDQVVVTGSIEPYKFSSQYQIIARNIEQDGAGDLFMKLEQLKKESEKETDEITGRCDQRNQLTSHQERTANDHQCKQRQHFSSPADTAAVRFDQYAQHKSHNKNTKRQ